MQKNICMKFNVKFNMRCFSALAFVCLMYYPLFNGAVATLLGLNTMLGNVVMSMLIGIEALLIYGSLLCCTVRNGVLLLSTYSIVALLYLLTMLFFPENTIVLLGTVRKMVLFCIPSFLIAFYLTDYDKAWSYLCKLSFVIIFCGVLYFIFQRNNNTISYSMWLGYQLTIPTMALLWSVFSPLKNKYTRLFSLLFFLAGSTIIILGGSRGPILVLITYSIYCFYECFTLNIDKNHKLLADVYRKLVFGIITVVILLTLINIQMVAESLYTFAQSFGFASRTLRVLAMDNALTYISGRDVLYNISFMLIKENPLIGYGLVGDCIQIGKILGVEPDLYAGLYAHNFYLSLMLHFGVFIGTLFFGCFIYLMYKKSKMLKEGPYRNLFVLLLIYVSIQLMISANYLTAPVVWLLVGTATNRQKGHN